MFIADKVASLAAGNIWDVTPDWGSFGTFGQKVGLLLAALAAGCIAVCVGKFMVGGASYEHSQGGFKADNGKRGMVAALIGGGSIMMVGAIFGAMWLLLHG